MMQWVDVDDGAVGGNAYDIYYYDIYSENVMVSGFRFQHAMKIMNA